ncbi:MAG: ATP-binding protein [Candidatus Thorarchaeota archaeon]
MEKGLFSKKLFPDKTKIDEIILSNPSPFILQTTTKSSIPEVFVGRIDEIKIIVETIKRAVENESCIALYVEGAGGSGKSTLYGHIFRAIKQKKYHLIDLRENYKLDAVFLDAPEDPEYCNILYVYSEIMQNLGKSSFLDELSFLTLKKVLGIIEYKYERENPLKEVKDIEDYINSYDSLEKYEKSINIVKNYYRILRTKEGFNFDWQFLEKLWLVLHPDFDISIKAVDELNATAYGKEYFIKNKTDASKIFNIITNLIGWLYGDKKVGIIVGIDNIESLLGSKQEDNFINFINMLLDFRNKITRTLLIIIGTSSTWMEFISFLKNSDYYNQFQGLFSSNNISLKFLELAQVKQIVKKHLDRLYNEHAITLPVEYSLYPFSPMAIEYLYRISAKNIRNVKIFLNDYWEEFQETGKIKYISDAFAIMKKFKKDIILDDYEVEILYEKLWSEKIKTAGTRSTLVEKALQDAFEILRTDPDFDIYSVENNPQERIKDNSKFRTVRPDIVVNLASKYKIGEMKRIEFQVKIYEKRNSVLRSHVETSRKLLEQKKIDFVYFVTTSDFSKTLISELKDTFPERIGGVYPLTKTEQAYLSLLMFYESIYEQKLTPSFIKILLKKSLGIDIGEFFEIISGLPKMSITPTIQPTLETFTPQEKIPEIEVPELSVTTSVSREIYIKQEREEPKKTYPLAIEDILLFMYRRTGRYKWQTTFNFLKGKLLNFRDEEVKEGFNWLKRNSKYTDNVSSTSIKVNDNGIEFLRSLNKI